MPIDTHATQNNSDNVLSCFLLRKRWGRGRGKKENEEECRERKVVRPTECHRRTSQTRFCVSVLRRRKKRWGLLTHHVDGATRWGEGHTAEEQEEERRKKTKPQQTEKESEGVDKKKIPLLSVLASDCLFFFLSFALSSEATPHT